jgi:hypothetical protein
MLPDMDNLVCKVPNADNLQGLTFDADYNGHGTSIGDIILGVGIPLAVGLSIVLMMVVYWRANGRVR